MAGSERLTTSLSESILTVLCFDNSDKSNLIANLIQPELFESYYRNVAEKVLEFRQAFKQAPGVAHIDDLFDDYLSDPKHKLFNIYTKILQGLYEQHRSGINVDYITSRVSQFIRNQLLKSGVLQAAQRIQQGGDNAADDVERILLDTVQKKVGLEDPGTFLGDKDRALRFLISDENEYSRMAIKELDKRRICPTRKELFLLIASRKRGKSQALIHIGKLALLQRWKVAHITLEMSENVVIQRYFQSMFSISKRNEKSIRTSFELDEIERVIGFSVEKIKAKLNLEDPNIRKKLVMKMDEWGMRLNNVVVKQFPTGSLTVKGLEAYLDSIEISHKFVPDMCIIDYPALMRLNVDNYTHALGQVTVALRGLAVKRNLAMVVVAQGNRESEQSSRVESSQVAGDISMVSTADTILTYSQTTAERKLGLARLYVSNARNDSDRFTVLIAQDYSTGQFCIDSALMVNNYDNLIEVYSGKIDNDVGDDTQPRD